MSVNLYKILKEKGEIKGGHIIDNGLLSDLIGSTKFESWEYLGPVLALKEKVEEEGFFCKIVDFNLYILPPEYNPYVAKQRIKSAIRKKLRTQRTLENTNIDSIKSKVDKEELLHQLRIISALNRQSKLILKETRYYELE